ncbi:hypothetical protein ACFHYQ_16050 [Sphaerimonospora cavernae]|uniref:ATPase PglY 5th domain-containing protein n=1 Tax=Sphaerimonospora cavernae TaxID=1740611 RepID=A0ABV6U5V2_9ACTN
MGEALENAFLFTADTFPWRKQFTQRAAQDGLDQVIPVAELIKWLDQPRARGLDAGTRGLVIARKVTHHDAAVMTACEKGGAGWVLA